MNDKEKIEIMMKRFKIYISLIDIDEFYQIINNKIINIYNEIDFQEIKDLYL